MILANHGIVSSSGGLLPSTLLTNLYAVYKAENNANDSLGVYNGTAQGGLTYSTGKSGNAFTFNGTTGLVALPNSSFDFMNKFSISAWVKIPSAPTAFAAVFGNYNYLGLKEYGYAITINTSKNIRFELHGAGGSNTFSGTTVLALNTWYHITIIRDSVSKTSYMYINGALEAQATNTGIAIAYGANAIQPTIGALRWNDGTLQQTNFLNGSVDELYIWNKELIATEVTELYNAGAGKFYPY